MSDVTHALVDPAVASPALASGRSTVRRRIWLPGSSLLSWLFPLVLVSV